MHDRPVLPAVLVAFPYAEEFLRVRPLLRIRSWALDCGAFTAHQSGRPVSLAAYIDFAREVRRTDPLLEDVFALDVIGDWRATVRNAEKMWSAGVDCVPCWHLNEPEHMLTALAETYPKIAVGSLAGVKGSRRVAVLQQVVARIWPKKVHGFGISDAAAVLGVPLHSCDSSTWELDPMRYRWFKSMGGRARLRCPCDSIDLRGEVDHYMNLESRMRARWRKALSEVE